MSRSQAKADTIKITAPASTLYIGLMSGTSADALDAALVDLQDERRPRLVATHSRPLAHLRDAIHSLSQAGHNEIQRMGQLSRQLAELSAKVVLELLDHEAMAPERIAAIGSHGQTVRHEPPGVSPHPYTLQIACPSTIAELTEITTVADFRCRDMAAGGQGAPLAPAFHKAVFAAEKEARAIVNIGGMANITLLAGDHVLGFDTGPGNCLMDCWTLRHRSTPFDQDGKWAASGQLQPELLKRMLGDPYFRQPPPKSTGREHFNHHWLEQHVGAFEPVDASDVQRTLLELTAYTVVDAMQASSAQPHALFICGGGAHNPILMHRLSELAGVPVSSTAALGVEPQWVEAMAFAWLASRTLRGLAGNEPQVTGARSATILGGIYPGKVGLRF